MKQEDISAFRKILDVLGVIFDKPASAERVTAYFEFLHDYTIEQIDLAAKYLAKNCKFFPTVAEFAEAVDGTIEDRAGNAWAWYTNRLLKRPGIDHSLQTNDRYLHQVLRELDLWGLAASERQDFPRGDWHDEPFVRKEFVKRYVYHMKHSPFDSLPDRLPGVYEQQNRIKIANGEFAGWTLDQKRIAASYLPESEAKALLPPEKENL